MEPSPSVLAVTSELPWPLDTGGRLRTFHLVRALGRRFRVRLVTAVPIGREKDVDVLQENGIEVCPVFVAPRVRWREAIRATAAGARGEPYVLYRRHDRRPVRAMLRAQLERERPDALYLDHLDSFVYRRMLPEVPCVIDLHNVYSTLVERTASEQASHWRRAYLRRESRLLARSERLAVRDADRIFAVSEDDGRFFEAAGARATSIVPNGVDCAKYQELPTGRRGEAPIILFVGLMSWSPNAAAAEYLAKTVLPSVQARVPGTRLRILGRDPSAAVKSLSQIPGVEVTGSVPDMIPYLQDAHVLAVPLNSGGGTRLKILEAFAAGLPVVSTPVGCEGLGVTHGEQLLIADRECFADTIATLLNDEPQGTRLASEARRLVRQRFDWLTIGDLACAAVRSAIDSRK